MSIEEALLKSAEAQNNLADAMNRYAGIMEKIAETGVTFVGTPAQLPEGATATAAASKPAADKPAGKKPTAAEKKAAEAAAAAAAGAGDEEEEDPFADPGETAAAKTYTTAEIRDLILKVRDKGGEKANAEGAKKVLSALGVKSMSEIPEDKYGKAAELCLAALK